MLLGSGNPYFLEPFWMKHATGSAVVVAGWHRMGYDFDDGSVISQELQRHIRLLHSVVGNAITQGKYIVFGAGSTQLLNAAVHALSIDNSSAPASVVASVPFYAVSFYIICAHCLVRNIKHVVIFTSLNF